MTEALSTKGPAAGMTPAVLAALQGEAPQTVADPEPQDDDLEPEDGVEGEDGAGEEQQEGSEDETTEDELPQSIKDILAKNRKDLRDAKAALKAAQKELAAKESNPDADAVLEGEAYKKLFMGSVAKASLAEAGATSGLDRLVKLIDFDDVAVNTDGSVDGLGDQIAGLKEDFPELFANKAPKSIRVSAKSDAAPRPAPEPKQSSAQRVASALFAGN